MVIALWIFAAVLSAQTRYELLLKGGHVIDPANNIDGVMDVGIASGRIARVASSIADADAQRIVDARGLYVTPGLVDIHVHAYAGTGMKGAYSGDNEACGKFGLNFADFKTA
jgi:dihydroorotase